MGITKLGAMGKKIFYTEQDIERLVAQGTTHLAINDDVVLTDLAREKAAKLELRLVEQSDPAQQTEPANPIVRLDQLKAKIKAAVRAQIGHSVPETLLDMVISRILTELKLEHVEQSHHNKSRNP